MSGEFVVPVRDLLRRPGGRRHVALRGAVAGVALPTMGTRASGDATADLTLEALPGPAVLVSGTVAVDWRGECRRCLGPAAGRITAEVRELFERGGDSEETYPLDGDRVDVGPLVRDAVLLELPLAPVCREACAGLCPVCGASREQADCGHTSDTRDPRWAALDELKDS